MHRLCQIAPSAGRSGQPPPRATMCRPRLRVERPALTRGAITAVSSLRAARRRRPRCHYPGRPGALDTRRSTQAQVRIGSPGPRSQIEKDRIPRDVHRRDVTWPGYGRIGSAHWRRVDVHRSQAGLTRPRRPRAVREPALWIDQLGDVRGETARKDDGTRGDRCESSKPRHRTPRIGEVRSWWMGTAVPLRHECRGAVAPLTVGLSGIG